MRLAPLFGLALLAGCPSSPPADAGHDTGVDAPESDVPGDAGPCGMACTGTTPFCDTASGMCVECLAPTGSDLPDPRRNDRGKRDRLMTETSAPAVA